MRENYTTNRNPDKVSPYLPELGDVFELWGEDAVGGDDRLQRGGGGGNVRAEQNRSEQTGEKVLPEP